VGRVRSCPSCHRVWNEANEYCPADGSPLAEITADRDPLVGLVLDGRYRLSRLLGSGGMGFVYLAEQIGLGREVAIKMLYAERTRDRQSLRRFRREAVALAGIDHRGVVRVLEYGDGGGTTPYIVMEKVEGLPLDDVLSASGRLPPRHAVHVAAELARALAAAHEQGVVHRDLKPANVQLDVERGTLRPRILDFGLALLAEGNEKGGTGGERLTRQGVIFGTPEYMSPEQIKGKGADSRSDLYALGVVLYELLAGTPPFVGVTNAAVLGMHIEDDPPPLALDDLDEKLCQEIDRVVRGLLTKSPELRLQDAALVARRLEDLAKKLPDGGPVELVMGHERVERAHPDTLHEVDASSGSSPRLSERPFAGLTGSADADRALEAALAEAKRERRVRYGLIAAVAVVALLVAAPFAWAYLGSGRGENVPVTVVDEDGNVRDVGETRFGRLPALTKQRRASEIVAESSGAHEAIPGGAAQAEYEAALHDLDRTLAARGLRTRDIRVLPEARVLWSSQDAHARGSEFAEAASEVRELEALGREAPIRDVAAIRLRAVEQRIGSAPTAIQSASLSALRETLPDSHAPRDTVRRFMRRLDDLDESTQGGR
jgi:serine/threonine-protein kinase